MSAGSAELAGTRTSRGGAVRKLGRDYLTSLVGYFRARETLSGVERYVMFAGYPRSGHSLIGSLLNAHPDAVVAHELDALRYVRARFSRGQILALLLARDREFEAVHDRAPGRYDYRVPGQWQGRARRLRVLGDKKGGATAGRLVQSPELFDRLRATVRLPLRIIHVTRSPFDNIAAIYKMEHRRKGFTLARSADLYFQLAESNAALEARVEAHEWFELAHEDFVADADAALRRLCGFLEIEADEAYLRDCATIVYPNPHRTRDDAPWTPELIDDVRRRALRYRFLARYAADACAPVEART